MRGEVYLTKPQQYALVRGKGSSQASGLVVMRFLSNGLPLSRYGFSVSKRVGKAVMRNRVKRRLREILRVMPLRPGWDVVFVARPAVAAADYYSVKREVVGLLSRASLIAGDAEAGVTPEPKSEYEEV